MDSEQQLQMNFDAKNTLKEYLDAGKFCYLIEYATPRQGSSANDYLPKARHLAEVAKEFDEIVAFSLEDRCAADSMAYTNFVQEFYKSHGRAPVVHIAGKGREMSEISSALSEAEGFGAHSLLAMTGNLLDESEEYVESVDILESAKKNHEKLLRGAVVNNFKYTVNSTYGQYLKMVMKLSAGADYIVSQAGVDMRKYDELVRFCSMRDINVPLIARLVYIEHEQVKHLQGGTFDAGVPCSREYASYLIRRAEAEGDFEDTQLSFLALQVIGCRLMGYNGVQIRGIKTATELNHLMHRVKSLSADIRSLEAWHQAWAKQTDKLPLTNPPFDFYVFKQEAFEKTRPTDRDSEGVFEREDDGDFIFPPKFDITMNKILRFFKAENDDALMAKLLRKLEGLSEAPGDLQSLQYLNMNDCPKKLVHGTCGGGTVDGLCENGKDRCIHIKRTALAAYFNELNLLEEL